MSAALESLAQLPGLQLVMLVTPDGVPIAVPGHRNRDGTEAARRELTDETLTPELGRDDALAAIATGWLNEIQLSVGQISWNEPGRAVLKGARGTLVMQATRNAVLLVILSRGQDPEEVRLSMDSTVARIQRTVSGAGRERQPQTTQSHSAEQPGPLPAEPASSSEAPPAEVIHLGQENDASED